MIPIWLYKTKVLDASVIDRFLASNAHCVFVFLNGTQWGLGSGPCCLGSCVRVLIEPVEILSVSVSMHEVSFGPFYCEAFGSNPLPPIKARGYLPADPPPTFRTMCLPARVQQERPSLPVVSPYPEPCQIVARTMHAYRSPVLICVFQWMPDGSCAEKFYSPNNLGEPCH